MGGPQEQRWCVTELSVVGLTPEIFFSLTQLACRLLEEEVEPSDVFSGALVPPAMTLLMKSSSRGRASMAPPSPYEPQHLPFVCFSRYIGAARIVLVGILIV
jgi:hypothetical protein